MDDLIAEARALALYVSRHGCVLSDDEHKLHKTLLDAIETAVNEPSTEGCQEKLMTAYAKVTAVTYKKYKVNGRTILDTESATTGVTISNFWRIRSRALRPMRIGISFFVLALLFELFRDYWKISVKDTSALSLFCSNRINSLIVTLLSSLYSLLDLFLLPVLWGGLGACVFLTKRISDKLFELAYEESRMRGDLTRVFLGSMLGVVVVSIFSQDGQTTSRLSLATVAFVSGLGVNPVYKAFEALSEELGQLIRKLAQVVGGKR